DRTETQVAPNPHTAHAQDTSVGAVAAFEAPSEPPSEEDPSAPGGFSNIFGGLVTLPQQAIGAAQGWFGSGVWATQAVTTRMTVLVSPAPQLPLYQRNRNEIEKLLKEIDVKLRELDRDLQKLSSAHQPVMPPSTRPVP